MLGEPNPLLRQDPISWDKLHGLFVAPTKVILGLVLDLRRLTVSVPKDFIRATAVLLQTTWGPHRCSFQAKEAETLMGRLNHIAFGAQWLRHLLGNIYSSLAESLRINKSHLVRTSKHFCSMLQAIRITPQSPDGDAQRSFHTGEVAHSTHVCTLVHHIGRDLRHDLRLIERALSSGDAPKSCPIAYLIP